MQHSLSLEMPDVTFRPRGLDLAHPWLLPRRAPLSAAVAGHEALDVAGLNLPGRNCAAVMAGALTQSVIRHAGH